MTFIRKGEPYPYNLDRPPPPIQCPASADVEFQQDAAAGNEQTSGTQFQTETVNGTASDVDKLFSKYLPAPSPATTPANGKVTMETLFASASASASANASSTATPASSSPARNFVTPPATTPYKGCALLDTILASATSSPQGPIPASTPPFPHHVSSEPFPPPPSVPPSTRLAFATAHLHGDVSSSEPDFSSDPPSPTPHAAAATAHLIQSPQPTTSQLPQILTQEVISALLGMPPSRTSSVASSHRRYEGDVESSDDLHEVDSPIDERPPPHANRNKKHELGDVTPRPPLRGFASSEKVLPAPASAPASALPSIHSAPSVLPTAAAPSSIPAPLELVPTAVATTAPNSAPAAAPRVIGGGTSPAPRPLVPFHHEDATLWPYPRAPLDDRDDIVELDFADTSALSDVDAFEQRRRNGKNGRGGVKSSITTKKKKDREREREDIERSWDVPVPRDVMNDAGAGAHVVLERPSSSQQQQESLTGARVNATRRPVDVPCPSPHPQSGAVLEADQTQTTPGAATANDNKSKSKSKAKAKAPTAAAAANGSSNNNNNDNDYNAKAARGRAADATPTSNGGAGSVPVVALAKSTASTAIVEAMYAHSNGNGMPPQPLPKTDRNEFVREVLTLIHVSCGSPFFLIQS
jgi:hypothetical protein